MFLPCNTLLSAHSGLRVAVVGRREARITAREFWRRRALQMVAMFRAQFGARPGTAIILSPPTYQALSLRATHRLEEPPNCEASSRPASRALLVHPSRLWLIRRRQTTIAPQRSGECR